MLLQQQKNPPFFFWIKWKKKLLFIEQLLCVKDFTHTMLCHFIYLFIGQVFLEHLTHCYKPQYTEVKKTASFSSGSLDLSETDNQSNNKGAI